MSVKTLDMTKKLSVAQQKPTRPVHFDNVLVIWLALDDHACAVPPLLVRARLVLNHYPVAWSQPRKLPHVTVQLVHLF